MQDQINQSEDKEFNFPTNLTVLRDDPDWSLYNKTWVDGQFHDIRSCIDLFINEDDAFTSWLEVSAHEAEWDVRRAKKRIEELNEEIIAQREIITKAKEPINELKKHNIKIKKSTPGRPRQSTRYDISKKFVAQWVNSLMSCLAVNSLGELARVLGGDKMKCGQPTIWWRRQKQETLTSSNSLVDLLDVEIQSGKYYKGAKLRDIQTNPTLTDLIDLVKLAIPFRPETDPI